MDTIHRYLFALLAIFLISLALSVDFQQSITGFVGDLAVYLCMGQSFAYDFDCEYTISDLYRIVKDWGVGPGGVFLKKVGSKIFYAKPIIYPLLAAPFVRFLDVNGFLLFNTLLMLGMFGMGYLYLRCYNPPQQALLFSLTFFILQVGFMYMFTIVPEVMNMFFVTIGYFFWFLPNAELKNYLGKRAAFFQRIITSPFRYWLAAFFLGIATFSKLTNGILLLGPFLAYLFPVKGSPPEEGEHTVPLLRRGFLLGQALFVFGLTLVTLFGLQKYFTGEYDYQGGYRKVFYHPEWPHYEPDNTFDNGGIAMSPEQTIQLSENVTFIEKIFAFIKQRAEYTNKRMYLMDIVYYFFGRVGGLLPFFPMALVGLVLWIVQRRRRQTFILLSVALTVFLFLLVMPQNYVGGAAIGNRYFINTYPVFLFLFTRIKSINWLWFPWISGSLFLAPLICNPFQAHYHIGNFATRFPYTLLPLEQSLVANYPTNVNKDLNYVPFSAEPEVRFEHKPGQPHYWLTFANHNTYGYEWAMEREGFWVRGESKAQFILRYPGTKYHLTIRIQNGAVANTVKVMVAGQKTKKSHYQPGETKEYSFPITNPFPYFSQSLLKCSITSERGFIPKFEETNENDDIRYLGCFISIGTDPLLD